MSDSKLGRTWSKYTQEREARHRDAIHIAIAPVQAVGELKTGDRIGFAEAGNVERVRKMEMDEDAVGIVDPFLKYGVLDGEWFWMFLFQNTITSLRHDWTHPAFGDAITQNASRAWIKDFAAELDQTYNRLMEAAELWLNDQEYTYDNSEIYKGVSGDKWPVFWKHYEIVTGKKVEDHTATFYTCSC